jgi:hypothetical protein
VRCVKDLQHNEIGVFKDVTAQYPITAQAVNEVTREVNRQPAKAVATVEPGTDRAMQLGTNEIGVSRK